MNRKSLPPTLLCLAMLLCPCRASAAPGSENVYVLKQHDMYFGNFVTYLGTSGVKFVFPKYKIEIVAKSPSWKVLSYNQSNNAAVEMSLEDWRRAGLSRFGRLNFMNIGTTQNSFDKNFNVNVVTVRHSTMENSGFAISAFYRTKSRETKITAKELTYTQDIPISQKSHEVLAGLLKTPPEFKLPLFYNWIDEKGRKLPVWTTDSIERKHLSSAIFKYPTKYKLTKDQDEVVLGGVRKKEVEGIIDGLLGDQDPAKK